jgi:sugar/nucleoside kinase (ribokinase family)
MTISSKPKIFGTGLIALDLVMGAEEQSPVHAWAGGTCGNVLSIMAYLGWESFPIARMNGDPASQRVKADMRKWGVQLKFAGCSPTSHSPIIIQQIKRGRDGVPRHRFSWACPRCGEWLPGYRAITLNAVEKILPDVARASVFFMDRLSPAALVLAEEAAKKGALVFFEPSAKSDEKLLSAALKLAHVVKYADQRFGSFGKLIENSPSLRLEVQTLGEKGLRYRHRLASQFSAWHHSDAVKAPVLADTCGSGDWCTAGILSMVANGGLTRFLAAGASGIREALRYGQALAAWNCGFEGARGGMYAIDRKAFGQQITALLEGEEYALPRLRKGRALTAVACPACPPH